MREAFGSLTTRGRGFLAAGGTAFVLALFLGYAELVRVGALLILVPLATVFFVGRSRYRLGLVRSLLPTQVSAGQQATVQLDLSHDGRLPTGVLLLEDRIPYVLGVRPRFMIDRTGPRWSRTVSYAVRSEVRGRYEVGPLSARLSDPFGLVEVRRTFSSRSMLVVTPRVVPLPAIPLSGAWTGSGDNRPRAFASGSAEDVTVREYHRGDDLRRVHWRSSAHAGALMVRREEQPWQSRATLFLDNRRFSHRGMGAASSLEHAVSVAASAAVHLVQRGFTVRLVTAQDQGPHGTWHEHGQPSAEGAPLLESLAMLVETQGSVIDTTWLSESAHSGLLIAVLGELDERDSAALSRMRHSASGALAVVLDVAAWSPDGLGGAGSGTGSAAARTTAWLGANGWRAVAAAPEDPLASVWQELGAARRSVSSRPGSGPVAASRPVTQPVTQPVTRPEARP